jgi:putative peptidoglycan lipid II flippase
MAPFFAISSYLGWVNDEVSLIVRALRLLFTLGCSGLAYLFFAHRLKVAEIAGLRTFATSVLAKLKR